MPPPLKRRRYMPEEDLEPCSEAQGPQGVQYLVTREEEASSSSTCSSSFPLSSSSSPYPTMPSTPERMRQPAAETSSDSSPSSQVSFSSSLELETSLSSISATVSSGPEDSSSSDDLPDAEALLTDAVGDMVPYLVQFLLFKYQTKEVTTEAEMLTAVIQEYQEYFPVIFREASECLQLVFGIDVKEVGPISHSYVLVNTLGLTYDGLQSGERDVPTNGILILILSIIFLEGNCAPEEKIWEVLRVLGVYDGREHFVCGDPRKLITDEWVQEKYLEYRQVPDSDPARYEFLWGPRVHAETSKMEVLKFLAKITGCGPRCFPDLYEAALRDEDERAQANVFPMDVTLAPASESDGVPSSSLSCPE